MAQLTAVTSRIPQAVCVPASLQDACGVWLDLLRESFILGKCCFSLGCGLLPGFVNKVLLECNHPCDVYFMTGLLQRKEC